MRGGDSQIFMPMPEKLWVLPACAGVIPIPTSHTLSENGFTRMRGGDSIYSFDAYGV